MADQQYEKGRELEASGFWERALAALDRLAEFERPVQADGRLDPKVAVYAYAGAMALGMPDDDGVALPLSPALGFDSLEEVAATLARVVWLARRLRWGIDTVCALDAESQPLTLALAAAFGARSVGLGDESAVGRDATCLAVSATGDDPAELARRLEQLRERAREVRFYAVGLRHPVWEYPEAPAVVSVPVRLEFPWNRGEASAAEHAEAFGEALAASLGAALLNDDGTTEGQVRWYGRHARLNDGARVARGGSALLLESQR